MVDPITWLRRWRDWRRLRRMDDQMLYDIGCSRGLLGDGVGAWPWRSADESMERLGRFRLARNPEAPQPVPTKSAEGAPSVEAAIRRAA